VGKIRKLSLILVFIQSTGKVNMDDKFKWGIIGLGKIANLFAADLPFSKNGVIHAVASRSIDKAKDFAKLYGAKHAFGSYEEILAVGDLDAIYIATPHSLHHDNTVMCLQAGIPVLCEKPLAINSHQVTAMINIARKNNVFLMEALWTRFLPHYIDVKRIVDSGVLGPIIQLKADFGFEANPKEHNRLFKKALGGGALLDIGIYPIFAALDLLGSPTGIVANASFGDTGVDEKVDINLNYGDTCTALLHCTLLEDTPTELVITGEHGTLHVDSRFHEPNNYDLRIRDKNRKISNFKYNCNGYKYEADEVARCIRLGQAESDLMSLDSSAKLIQLLDQVRIKAGIYYMQYDV